VIDDAPEIAALHTRWSDAMSRGDIDAVLSMLEPSYVLWLPNAPEMTPETLRPVLAATFARGHVASSFECETRIVRDDLAVERGWDVQTLTPANGEPARSGRQRVTLVLRRGDDHQWRIAWGIGLGASG
jgi:uncharacterized protein (TIGR02246 family)